MNPKLFQWTAACALLAALGLLFFWNWKLTNKLTVAQIENQELSLANSLLRPATAMKAQELAKLRQDVETLSSLRQETQKLRQDKQQSNLEMQKARAQVEEARTQLRSARSEVQDLQKRVAQTELALKAAQSALATLRLAQVQPPSSRRTMEPEAATLACIGNLRRIEAAKLQWAMENHDSKVPTMTELAPYLLNAAPACPAGGTYAANAINALPTCSFAGHVLIK